MTKAEQVAKGRQGKQAREALSSGKNNAVEMCDTTMVLTHLAPPCKYLHPHSDAQPARRCVNAISKYLRYQL